MKFVQLIEYNEKYFDMQKMKQVDYFQNSFYFSKKLYMKHKVSGMQFIFNIFR